MKQGLVLQHFFRSGAPPFSIDNHLIEDEKQGEIKAKYEDMASPNDFVHSKAKEVKISLDQPNCYDRYKAAGHTYTRNDLAQD